MLGGHHAGRGWRGGGGVCAARGGFRRAAAAAGCSCSAASVGDVPRCAGRILCLQTLRRILLTHRALAPPACLPARSFDLAFACSPSLPPSLPLCVFLARSLPRFRPPQLSSSSLPPPRHPRPRTLVRSRARSTVLLVTQLRGRAQGRVLAPAFGLAQGHALAPAIGGHRSSTPCDNAVTAFHRDSYVAAPGSESGLPTPPAALEAVTGKIRTAVAAFLGKIFALLAAALVIGSTSFPQVSYASTILDAKWTSLPSVVSWNSPPTHSARGGDVPEVMAENSNLKSSAEHATYVHHDSVSDPGADAPDAAGYRVPVIAK